jgi:ankyrin repeat protein
MECASAMLDYGADVNSRNALGETPLMLLRQFDPNDPAVHPVLDQLLAKGADIMAKDDKGHTAEDWAWLYHRQEMAERLQKIRELEAQE